jgi:hypothetical protein
MEHKRRLRHPCPAMDGGVAVATEPSGGTLVDIRGTTGNRVLARKNVAALESGAGGGPMLRAAGIRSGLDCLLLVSLILAFQGVNLYRYKTKKDLP